MKSIIIFGAGKFGSSLTKELSKSDIEIMVVDKNHDAIEDLSDYVDLAMEVDISDDKAMEELGISNFDMAVVAIGSDLEASILATLASVEAGVESIIAKVGSNKQAQILKKLGVSNLIYPERDLAIRLANSITKSDIISYLHFSNEYSIVEADVKKSWVGKSLIDLNLREKYGFNIVALIRESNTIINPKPDLKFQAKDKVVIVGHDDELNKL